MRNIFDRLVRRDDRLELIDAAGEKQSTTAGPLTDSTGPEAINCRTLQLDFPPGRLNALSVRIAAVEQTTTTIARRLDKVDHKQFEDRKIRESYQAGQDHRLAEVERRTQGLAERLLKLADAITHPAAIESLERRLSKLETAPPSDSVKLSQALERIDALARRLEDHTTATNRDALSFAASVGDVHGNLTKRLAGLEQLTKTNFEDITNDRAEARHLAETVGNIHHDLKGAVGDLRRDLETLAAQVDETAKAVADRDQPPANDGNAPAKLRDDLNSLEVEFGESLAEISRLRNQCKETAAAVAKITSALSILSAFNRPTAPPNA